MNQCLTQTRGCGVLPTAMGKPLPLVVRERPPEYSDAYATERLFEDAPTSYWCSPTGPTFPVVMGFEVTAPEASIERFAFDTRIKGWLTSAAKQVAVEVPSDGYRGGWERLFEVELEQDMVQQVILAAPVTAQSLRLVISSNHGGQYAALARVQVIGSAIGVGEAMLPPGTPVTDGQRQGVVTASGYVVRWSDGQESFAPAGMVRFSAAAPPVVKGRRGRSTASS